MNAIIILNMYAYASVCVQLETCALLRGVHLFVVVAISESALTLPIASEVKPAADSKHLKAKTCLSHLGEVCFSSHCL